MAETTVFHPVEPYDFDFTLNSIASFSSDPGRGRAFLRVAARMDQQPALITIQQKSRQPLELEVSCSIPGQAQAAVESARWILFADLDLNPFYRLAQDHPVLGTVTRRLHGVKPTRPVSLFEMLVTAIIEQQISLAAANKIRSRLVERFGDPIDGLWVFPGPERLAQAGMEELQSCGLSQRKAEYAGDIARQIQSGALDLEALIKLPDQEVRETLLNLRGFGPWSADYFLIRGLARPDSVPVDDLAVRSVVGKYLGDGSRASAAQVSERLSPFTPYRGLAAFYLLVHDRLKEAN